MPFDFWSCVICKVYCFCSQSSPKSPDVVVTGQRYGYPHWTPKSPDVFVTKTTFFKASCEAQAKKANQMYNDDQVSCFKRLEVIGFKLGSSSKGDVPRRKRRILVPNSYFRDFEVNKCTARIHFFVNEKLAYECLMFYSVSPEHSK